MEVLFHFIFELVKISILGCIYASLTVVIFITIGFIKPNSWFDRVSGKKMRLWFLSGLLISVGLFVYMFTYFGNHGLGDSARIPVGHFHVVRQINGDYSYLQNNKGEQVGITNFTFDGENLYAQTQRAFNGEEGEYIIWDLKRDDWTFYKTKEEYIKFAKLRNYPLPDKFAKFEYFYKLHWRGIRFWILP